MGDADTFGTLGLLDSSGLFVRSGLMLTLIVLLELEDDTRVNTFRSLPASFSCDSVVKVREASRARPAKLPVVGEVVFCGRLTIHHDGI